MASESREQERRYVRPPRVVSFPVEAQMPEGRRHLELRTALFQILRFALGDRATIGCDQFVYWDPTDPSGCLAPDAFVRLGPPDERFDSWKTWERGAPHLAVEIVSESDASEAAWAPKLAKYRRVGVAEVVRFDPDGGSLRIWNVVEGDLVERVLVGGAAAECVPLGLFWVVVPDELGEPMLRLARHQRGMELLPTPEEAARRERDVALEKVRQLEAALAKRG